MHATRKPDTGSAITTDRRPDPASPRPSFVWNATSQTRRRPSTCWSHNTAGPIVRKLTVTWSMPAMAVSRRGGGPAGTKRSSRSSIGVAREKVGPSGPSTTSESATVPMRSSSSRARSLRCRTSAVTSAVPTGAPGRRGRSTSARRPPPRRAFAFRGGIQLAGTNLTCDIPGVEPMNIVIKMIACNGQPVAKISDTPGKTQCRDENFVHYLKHVFRVTQ